MTRLRPKFSVNQAAALSSPPPAAAPWQISGYTLWIVPGMIVGIPMLALLLAPVVCARFGLRLQDVAGFALAYSATMLGITLGYHRSLTHRSALLAPSLKTIVLVLGAMAGQGPPVFWAAHHRAHHGDPDGPKDPYSPVARRPGWQNQLLGFLHAHVGWMFGPSSRYDTRLVRDLLPDPCVRWVEQHYFRILLAGLLLPALLVLPLDPTPAGLFKSIFWCGLVRLGASHQAAWMVNSVCHLWGYRRFETRDTSKNNWLVAALTLGEGWHNNHHADPSRASHGREWWEFDPLYALIRLFERLGLASEVRQPLTAVGPTALRLAEVSGPAGWRRAAPEGRTQPRFLQSPACGRLAPVAQSSAIPVNIQTLSEALMLQARGSGRLTILDAQHREHAYTYGELEERALRLLGYFQRSGARPGDHVVLCLSSTAAFVDALWACLLGGLVPVPLAAGGSSEARRKAVTVLGQLRQPFLFTERAHLERLQAETLSRSPQVLPAARRTLLVESITDRGRPGVAYPSRPDDVTLLQFSSGSTDTPKGVVITHRNVLSNLRSISAHTGLTSAEVSLSWMPLTHDMGLIGFHLLPLCLGCEQHLICADSFVRRPLLWLEKASEKRATILGSPNFGLRHLLKALDKSPPPALDLSSVRLIFNGAEPICADTCVQFTQALTPCGLDAQAVFPVYGLAEASLAVSFPEPRTPLVQVHAERASLLTGAAIRLQERPTAATVTLICVGETVDSCELRITDDAQSPLADGQVGRIQIRGSSITRGYYQPGGAGRQGFTVDGWLDTGDLGTRLPGRGLFIVGRHKDTIIVHGQNLYAHDLERICAGVEGAPLACAPIRSPDSTSDRIGVFVRHRKSLEQFVPLIGRLRAAIAAATGQETGAVIPVHTLPRTTSGKLQRFKLTESYAHGAYAETLAVIEQLIQASGDAGRVALSLTEQTLKEICDMALGGLDVGVDENLSDCGADSLALTMILMGIEERYTCAVTVQDLFAHPSISALAALLDRRSQAGRSTPGPRRRRS
jgi:acyl-CoA synthetase (AMP-forming)/AMP-acid ligase II/fatty-acid desaturase/acyl carrier protein